MDFREFSFGDGEPTVYYMPNEARPNITHQEAWEAAATVAEADFAHAHPGQSGYHVQFAARVEVGSQKEFYLGGNKENSHSDAFIHGETDALSAALTAGHDPEDITHLGMWDTMGTVRPEDLIVRSCGNCRDKLLEYLPPETLMASGNMDAVTVHTLGALTFDTSQLEDLIDYNTTLQNLTGLNIDPNTYRAAFRALQLGDTVALPEHDVERRKRMSGVAIDGWTWNGRKSWAGSHYTNVGYDAVTPAIGAVESLKLTGDSVDRIEAALIMSYGEIGEVPNPYYRDRQALLSLDECLRHITGRKFPLPVVLMSVGPNGFSNSTYLTNTEELLPFPFSASALGLTDSIAARAELLPLVDPGNEAERRAPFLNKY